MKKINPCFASVLTIIFLSLFISGCGKKDSTSSSGSNNSQKETATEKNSGGSKEESSSGIESNEIDVMINDYQKLLDEYVSIVMDVKGGKMSEIAKMQELSVKMSDWAQTFSDMTPRLTESQKERIRKITEDANGVMNK